MEMEELAGDRPGPPPPLHLPLPPDDLLLEILLRLPPEPIHLFRASLVSKHWRGLDHDARFRDFHGGMPPVLGVFNNQPEHPLFVPTTGGFALSTATMSHDDWWALDCRHGRALLERLGSGTLLVWDLMTGDQRHLPAPAACDGTYNGTVLCAAGHTDHGDRRWCPFLVVYVFRPSDSAICACVWSSETGVRGEITSMDIQSLSVDPTPSTLIGNKLYWLLENRSILEYDLDHHELGLIVEMPYDPLRSYTGQFVIMPTEDGRLGLAGVQGFNLHLWSLMASIAGHGLVTWTHQRAIDLENFLTPEVVATCLYGVAVIGLAEDAGVIFICMYPSVYMIHLKSMQIEEVLQKGFYAGVFPYTSFYSPGAASVSDVGIEEVNIICSRE